MHSAYPLSPLQMGMLYHTLKEPDSGVDIEQILFSLREPLELPAWKHAWTALLQRYDILRSRFQWEDADVPMQIVEPDVPVPIEVEEWTHTCMEERDKRLHELLKADRATDFNMADAPLMRFRCILLAEGATYFLWTFHHALLDGRSFPIVIEEVFRLYEAALQGEAAQLPPVRQYREYIDWVRVQDFDRTQHFWREYLHGFRTPTPFGIDVERERAATLPHGYQEQVFRLTVEETRQLEDFARCHNLTPNTVLMGAWALLLARYTNETDIVFGGTRACRASTFPDAQTMAGLFINTVPVRIQVDEDQDVIRWLKQLREQWVRLREYEHTPLSKIQSWSATERGQPLFESTVVFDNLSLNSRLQSLGGAWLDREFQYFGQTNFPLTIIGYHDQAVLVIAGYDQRRFEDSTIRRLLGHLRTLLVGLTASSEQRLADVSHLTPAEINRLVWERTHTQDYAVTECVHEWFARQAIRCPHAEAIVYEGLSLTYRELDLYANQLAQYLAGLGVGPETLVALYLDRSLDMVVAILGVLKAGGAYLPLDMAYPKARLTFMLEDAQPPVLITHQRLLGELPTIPGLQTVALDRDRERIRQQPDIAPTSGVRPENLAYVIYTSGSTGTPKGCMITHANVVRLFLATEEWYHFGENDIWTFFHSYAFDFSVWELWGALLYGGKLIVVSYDMSRSPEAFYELLVQKHVTVLNQTPSAFNQLMSVEQRGEAHGDIYLRYVIFGGEALDLQSLRGWFDRHGDAQPLLVNMYGITETTVHVTYRPIREADLDAGMGSVVGVPIPDLELYLFDNRGRLVPEGCVGEIYVGGAGVARGYLNRSELTAARFVDHPYRSGTDARLYRTGDLGRWVGARDLEHRGRADDQVKVRGFRIELGEIESVLSQHPSVRESVVLAREDTPGVKRLVAYLVTSTSAPEVSTLREHLKQKVPEYMLPAAFVFLEKLPLTTNGKVDRTALPVPAQQRPELADRYVAPRTTAEQKLSEIWSKVLRVERLGVNDNFFELGGDSILSMQIIASARHEGLKLTPKLLFAHQTIAELAAVAGVVDETHAPQEVIAGDMPLTPVQQWFFEQKLAEPQHYNQAFLFETTIPLDRSLLELVLKALSRQHDALRLRFIQEAGSWRQFYSTAAEPVPLIWTNIAALNQVQQWHTIEAVGAATQTSLNLQSGPLWRVAYFDASSDQPGRLLFVVHHLAVDSISWRPLLEDLETAYEQLRAGQDIQLPAKTTSYKTWAERLRELAGAEALRNESAYWQTVTDPQCVAEAVKPLTVDSKTADSTEGASSILKVSLSAEETQALLQQVPAAYNTQINDVFLTALARAWERWSGSRVLFTNLEGHGRENLFDDVDLSCTVGWFTSIFPVRLELPQSGDSWQPDEALKSIKEQLRQIPQRGIGYGILRYLSVDAGLPAYPELPMVFNYLGQFDQILAGSKLFHFAKESTGPWHSPKQRRRYALEVNSLVLNGSLEIWWTYSQNLHPETAIGKLANEFLMALKELIAHCQSPNAGGRTPADFPLARLDQSALDRLIAGRRDIEDIYPLSPIQTLFFSANPGTLHSTFDHWHCTLRGALNLAAFQRAWQETVRRYSILRSTIHGDGLREALQIVHRDVQLPWIVEDWRDVPSDQCADRWSAFLKQDRARPLTLTEAPVMRFSLVRLADETWKFLWSVPALLLDGWSWPLVFRDVSQMYEAFSQNVPLQPLQLELVRPYRDYLEWLGRQSSDESQKFWRESLDGFQKPTSLPTETPDYDGTGERYVEHPVQLSTETTDALQSAARRLQLTLSTLVQGAWALLLSRQSASEDVVFGAAFVGRPTDLRGADSIVGPFVNNLPIRTSVNSSATIDEFLRQLQARLLELSQFQYTPLMEIQRNSEVPWRYRMFDSLIVFQNYLVDESARSFGGRIEIADFIGPIHTNYPIMLLAEPGVALRLKLIYDRQSVAHTTVERWGSDLAMLLQLIPAFLEKRIAELQALLSPPAIAGGRARQRLQAQAQNFVPPQTEMERTIAGVWQKMFGLEQVSVEENFFDLGGHSLLLIQMHDRLREILKTEFPIVALLEYPSIHLLARHLDHSETLTPEKREQWRDRAQRQKQALAQLRTTLKK